MKNILIDSDVIIDLLSGREPFNSDAEKIFTLCNKKVVRGFVTPVIISNVYYILHKQYSHHKIMKIFKQLFSFIDILPINDKPVFLAMDSQFSDFEDALQNFTAVESGIIDIIITKNSKDFNKSILQVMTPKTFLKTLQLD